MVSEIVLSICLLKLVSGETLIGNCSVDQLNYTIEYPIVLPDNKFYKIANRMAPYYYLDKTTLDEVTISKNHVILYVDGSKIDKSIIDDYIKQYMVIRKVEFR